MRLLVHVLALVVGAAAGLAAIGVHRSFAGLALGVLATLAALWTLRAWRRTAATWFAGGWVAVLAGALAGRPEGDYAVAADLRGYLLIGAGLVVLAVGVVSLSRHDAGSVADRT